MEKKIWLFVQLILLFSSPLVLAQEQPQPPQFITPEWIKTISSWWAIFLVGASALITGALITRVKWILYAGIGALYLTIILIVGGVMLPLFGAPTVTYEQCISMFKPGVSIFTMPGLFYTVSCIFTGYVPQNLDSLSIATFTIFGIIAPLALLISLFFSFMPTFIIENKYAQRVIAVVGALIAFRGFFATFLIQLLEYGFAGIGALMVGTLFTGFVWKACEKFVSPLGIDVGTSLKIMRIGYYQELENELRMLENALDAATKAGNKQLEAEIQQKIENIKKLMKKVEKGKT
ncbi:MAG: hypothetical protein QXG39_07855 [Candidatus Aenigmatarchaeota archaeon]